MSSVAISQLNELAKANVEAVDLLPIVDNSANETKKITVKNLQEAALDLIDNSSIDIAKIDQSSTTKIGATAIGNGAVTYAKIQNVSATNILLGRSSAGPGIVEEISCTAAGRALLDDADASAQRTTLGLGSVALLNTINGANITAGSIDATALGTDAVITAKIQDGAVTNAKIASSTITSSRFAAGAVDASALASDAVTTVKIQDNGVTTAKLADGAITTAKMAASSVDTTVLASGSVSTVKVQDGAITYAKLQNASASNVLLGRSSAGPGVFEEITCTSAGRALLDDADASAQRTTLGLGSLAVLSTISGANIANNSIVTALIDDDAVTAIKLADNSATVVAGNVPSAAGSFIGQRHINSNTGFTYTWDGSSWIRTAALATVTFSDSTPLSFSVAYPDAYSATVTTSLDNQSANTIFAGPASGSSAAPAFRALVASDLPIATSVNLGGITPGTGLNVTGAGVLNHINTVASGIYTKVTVDSEGHISAGTSLTGGDIPSLDASKIITGTFAAGLFGTNSITGEKLADSSTVQFGGAGSTSGVVTFPNAEFKGQQFWDELNGDLYLWSGSAWLPITITSGELVYAGAYNASTNQVASVTSAGSAAGLTVGAGLPAASSTNNRYYVVVSQSGNGTGNAPPVALAPPDMILSNGATWDLIDVSNAIAGQTASNISFTPYGGIIATNVQTALQELDDDKLAKAGGTMTGELLIGHTGSFKFEGSTDNAYETEIVVVDPTADRTITVPNVTGTLVTTGDTGSVTSTMIADGTIVDGDINASAAISGSKIVAATTSVVGVVQLTDSTSSTSTTTAATPNAVKSAYDLANAALPKAGGTLTGDLTLNAQSDLRFADADSSNWVALQAPSGISGNVTWTLPSGDGSSGQALSTNGTGSLSWASYAALATAQSFTAAQRGSVVTIAGSGTVTIDLALANNFATTLSGSTTFALPSGLVAGQSGALVLTQDGTGSRLVSFSGWKFPGGTAPTATTTASGVDVIVYYVESASRISARMINDVK